LARKVTLVHLKRSEPVEEKRPFPSDKFGPATKTGLAKAATVTLPYPPPASGKLYLGINPDSNPDLCGGAPRFFLRLVQAVSPKREITRILDLDELRGVSLPRTSTPEGSSSREFKTVNEITKEIEYARSSLDKAEGAQRGVYEVCLFEDAVIYVRESAPVFLRIVYEFGVSAADAAEDVDILGKHGCTCPMLPPSPYPKPPVY
jgi:hypothetical protein